LITTITIQNWLYSTLNYDTNSIYLVLLILVCTFVSLFLLYLLVISSTIFIGLLLLLLLFCVQIIMLYVIGQQLFALFLLGVYVGAILVFFVFVVMSFIFFGKTYLLSAKLWLLCMVSVIASVFLFYFNYLPISCHTYDSLFFDIYSSTSSVCYYDELSVIGVLIFNCDMMYVVIVISLLLLVALFGSITFNAINLAKYSSSFYLVG